MKIKRFIKQTTAIILAAILTISLSACSGNETKLSSESTSKVQSSAAESSVISESSITENSAVTESTAVSENSDTSSVTETDIPAEWLDDGIFSEYYDEAYSYLQDMTIDEKIGQMLFARCPSENAVETAAEYHLGGYVLFGNDFDDKSTDEVISDITSYKNAHEIPLAVATDEEGGTVTRVSSHSQLYGYKFSSPRDIYSDGGMEKIKSEETAKAELLSSLNIDTNFAPVCDISVNEDDFMYDRSIGEDAQTTAEFVGEATKISQSNGVSTTLKHFPGYGNNVDTHTGIAVDERDYDTFVNNDFIPFQAGIESGAHLVMVSHNIVECMDGTKPASISAEVHNILRTELGFTGIIVTDDLSMDAIGEYSGEYPSTVTAVLAGNDMLTVSDIETSFNEIKQAVDDGIIEQSTIDHAVMRILAWKYFKNLMDSE